MTIQIDDAGWGSLVGGVLIGACRKESPQTQHAFREIDVSRFQGDAFAQKLYLVDAGDAAIALMVRLNATLDEPVEICSGYILRPAKQALTVAGYHVNTTKIGDPLQTLIEQEFLSRVLALGVRTDLEILTQKQGLYFWQCMYWLKGGNVEATEPLPERERHCKTGWSSYPIWAHHPYAEAKPLAKAHKQRKRRHLFDH